MANIIAMVNYRSVLVILAVLTGSLGFAQDTNVVDASGAKQGFWIVYGGDIPSKGYPENGIIEQGNYVDNRKEGMWIKYHEDGVTPRLKAEYVEGRPHGKYLKYTVEGKLKEDGTFENKKPVGDLKIYDKDGNLQQEKTFNKDGKVEGREVFYYPDGTVEYELEKNNGVPVGTATRYYPNGDIKKIITYNDDGTIKEQEERDRVNPPKGISSSYGSGGPSGKKGIIKDGSVYQSNGYNKLYNEAEELWMDGYFKNDKLWDGKLYKYDSDGILLKIEIWKEGKYHSDGVLK